jgi:hypothetical protein
MHPTNDLILGIGSPYAVKGPITGHDLVTLPTSALMHAHCIGKSGYGKSYWLASLFVLLLSHGVSATLIDPSGDLARLVLKLLIATRFFETYPDAMERVIYLDIPRAAERERFVPFNVLNASFDPYSAADMVLEAFKRAWPALKGGSATNIEVLVKTGAYVLAANKLPLLPYLSYLFTNPTFREQLLQTVTDAVVRNAFTAYGFTKSGQVPASMVPTIKRLHLLSFAPVLRYSLGQPENTLDFRQLLDSNRSLILNLNLPSMDTVRFFGCFTTVYAEAGAKSRGAIDAQRRRGAHLLIVDEFQNFVAQSGDALSTILEECRKYGLFVCLAHQYWDQVPEGMRGALNQCELEITFHLERTDAKISEEVMGFPFIEQLRKPTPINPRKPLEYMPQFFSRQEQRDIHTDAIVSLPKREAIVRLPGSQFYRMRTLDIDVRGVTERAIAEVENAYLTRYFRAKDTIDAQTAPLLAAGSQLPEDERSAHSDDPDSKADSEEREHDDYDLF